MAVEAQKGRRPDDDAILDLFVLARCRHKLFGNAKVDAIDLRKRQQPHEESVGRKQHC